MRGGSDERGREGGRKIGKQEGVGTLDERECKETLGGSGHGGAGEGSEGGTGSGMGYGPRGREARASGEDG